MINLTNIQKQVLKKVGHYHNLRFIILHGSRARNSPRKGSDLDIAILGKNLITFDETLEIHDELGRVLGDNKERELDLKTLHKVDPLFRFEVVKDGILLYGDRTEFDEFRLYALRDYIDSYDLRKLESILLKRGVQSLAKRYSQFKN